MLDHDSWQVSNNCKSLGAWFQRATTKGEANTKPAYRAARGVDLLIPPYADQVCTRTP